MAAAGLLCFSACSDEPSVDRIKGSYNCEAQLFTRYQKNGKWRDTSYVYRLDNSVVIAKVDDNTVSVKAHSKKWGDAVVENVGCSDIHYEASFGRTGTYTLSNHSYPADISGTVSYETRRMAVSVRVNNYPNSGGKYIISFSNSSY